MMSGAGLAADYVKGIMMSSTGFGTTGFDCCGSTLFSPITGSKHKAKLGLGKVGTGKRNGLRS